MFNQKDLLFHPETSQLAPRHEGNNIWIPTLQPQVKKRLQRKGVKQQASGFHKKFPYPTRDWEKSPTQSTRGFLYELKLYVAHNPQEKVSLT